MFKRKRLLIFICIFTFTIWYIYHKQYYISNGLQPLIFIGGFPRSGTTLMRILLDVHPEIRCGPETQVIPKILQFRNLLKLNNTRKHLVAANLYPHAVDEATKAFIITVITNAGQPASVLCNKDPFSFSSLEYLALIFPNAKFINMIRDGRAVISSIHTRHVPIKFFPTSVNDQFLIWEKKTKQFYDACNKIGRERCINVFYEKLVLNLKETLHTIMSFLQLSVHMFQLNHQNAIISESYLNPMEKSTSQVIYAINVSALNSWYSADSDIGLQFKQTIHLNSTMLNFFGYDKIGIPPNYNKFVPRNI